MPKQITSSFLRDTAMVMDTIAQEWTHVENRPAAASTRLRAICHAQIVLTDALQGEKATLAQGYGADTQPTLSQNLTSAATAMRQAAEYIDSKDDLADNYLGAALGFLRVARHRMEKFAPALKPATPR